MALHVALARDLTIQDKPQPRLLMGRHLVDLGMKPGRAMGVLLARALEAQLDGEFEDTDGATRWAAEELQRRDEA